MDSSGIRSVCSHLSQGRSASVHAGIPAPQERSPGTDPPEQTPWSRPPRADTPLHAGIAHPLETCCKACWDTTCKAYWDTTPLCGQTDTCKNITFATSLRTVKINGKWKQILEKSGNLSVRKIGTNTVLNVTHFNFCLF